MQKKRPRAPRIFFYRRPPPRAPRFQCWFERTGARRGSCRGERDERGRKQKRAFILQDKNQPFRPHTTLKSGGRGGAPPRRPTLDPPTERPAQEGQQSRGRFFCKHRRRISFKHRDLRSRPHSDALLSQTATPVWSSPASLPCHGSSVDMMLKRLDVFRLTHVFEDKKKSSPCPKCFSHAAQRQGSCAPRPEAGS